MLCKPRIGSADRKRQPPEDVPTACQLAFPGASVGLSPVRILSVGQLFLANCEAISALRDPQPGGSLWMRSLWGPVCDRALRRKRLSSAGLVSLGLSLPFVGPGFVANTFCVRDRERRDRVWEG